MSDVESAAAKQGEAYVSAAGEAGGDGADATTEETGEEAESDSAGKVGAGGEGSSGKLITNIAHSPESFRMNATLRSLLLSGNGIGPAGAKSLATMVRHKS